MYQGGGNTILLAMDSGCFILNVFHPENSLYLRMYGPPKLDLVSLYNKTKRRKEDNTSCISRKNSESWKSCGKMMNVIKKNAILKELIIIYAKHSHRIKISTLKFKCKICCFRYLPRFFYNSHLLPNHGLLYIAFQS